MLVEVSIYAKSSAQESITRVIIRNKKVHEHSLGLDLCYRTGGMVGMTATIGFDELQLLREWLVNVGDMPR